MNPDYDNMYEIIFEDYVFHITRNESYASYDEWEIRKGVIAPCKPIVKKYTPDNI